MSKETERKWGGAVVIAGQGEGRALVTRDPISFWGDVDPKSGKIVTSRHHLCGECFSGKVLVFPHGRGSTSGSGVLLECIRLGTAPAGIVNQTVDPILAAASVIGEEMYGRAVPIVVLEPEDFESIATGDEVLISEDGTVSASG